MSQRDGRSTFNKMDVGKGPTCEYDDEQQFFQSRGIQPTKAGRGKFYAEVASSTIDSNNSSEQLLQPNGHTVNSDCMSFNPTTFSKKQPTHHIKSKQGGEYNTNDGRQSVYDNCWVKAKRILKPGRRTSTDRPGRRESRVMARRSSSPKKRRCSGMSRDPIDKRANFLKSLARQPIHDGGSPLTTTPVKIKYILKLKKIKQVLNPVFCVAPEMHYSNVNLDETPVFGGAGGYGEVKIYKQTGVAIKTSSCSSSFEHELLISLIAGECSLQGKASFGIHSIIYPIAFSLPEKQMVFNAYDMDLNLYCYKLSLNQALNVDVLSSIKKSFIDLGKAIVYLNIKCGLTHLDIKGGNIFVNTNNFIITECVLGDFSLMTLNTNSTVTRSEFEIITGDTKPKVLCLQRGSSKMVFSLLLGHACNQPLEVLSDFINRSGLMCYSGSINHDIGLSVDMYALGQVLLELLLTNCLSYLPVSILRNPSYYYYSHRVTTDYALDILAYRCILYPYILPRTPLTTIYGSPWNEVNSVNNQLMNTNHKAAFIAHYNRYQFTHKNLFESIIISSEFAPLFELAAIFCHANPSARSSVPVLWTVP
ncbi:tegument serine/threonine protein kinase [Canid alphaherpesvirus 1]|uniref:Tegument serine/threonine protein kinase n=1 Tax=Canid alphaherpesvirus 1 TaxID=170325 RepID=A0A172DSF4_9ALPH|nr:tegument serine/threonine protein kinase [Canid alphaherpesvirus 1]ALL26003.1 tegument serine/threonine protein kinase [Canid alphaherpesvirus 1]ALL26078.1 tegument serine/threonine protein kinase [Canid alphaherpesvirus 1]ARE29850.1 tegument serine/threonine protein kinase [Canid alphaherpesvirus 1]QQL08582.1 tegument serine/threonine protein kinase [Canid alphaherpesvirus 1]QQL08657.1 tegument serine/threonine protein kinase [Canid alphaherpesvirus 1]